MKPTVWRDAIRDSELDRTAKLVCFVISTYMNGAGEAYPAKETIARGAGLGKGKRSVDLAIDRIEEAGFLEVERFRGRRSFNYRATAPNVAADARLNGAADAMLEGGERRTNERPTSQRGRANVARAATESGLKRFESVTPQPPAERGARKITQKEMRRYTGWRVAKGAAEHYVEDPLGTDRPPPWFGAPDRRPTEAQVIAALEERGL